MINVITTINSRTQSSRAVGYYPTIEEAKDIVINNRCDLNETIYDYAVIEDIAPGLYRYAEQPLWFVYNPKEDKYDQMEKPPEWAYEEGIIMNWCGIG